MITVNQIIAFLSLDDARRTHARASAPENTGTVNSENTPARRRAARSENVAQSEVRGALDGWKVTF